MAIDFRYFVFLAVSSFIPSLFWLFCYYFYFPRLTTPKLFLGVLFFWGMVAAGAALLIHQNILRLFPGFVYDTFQNYLSGFASTNFVEMLVLFLLMFFLVAPIEELLKFFVIDTAIRIKPSFLDQIIDGIKFGVVVGLGFAAIENLVYFYRPLLSGDSTFFLKLFLTRFLISTLAHSLYTGIMGYYIGLSRLYRLHSGHFIRKGLIIAIAMHGVFNFFLLINLGFFSIGVLVVLLWLMIKWGRERESLESLINAEKYQNIFVPVFSGKKEFESFLFQHKIRYDVVKKLNLCPFCFRKKGPNQNTCPHCRMKQPV